MKINNTIETKEITLNSIKQETDKPFPQDVETKDREILLECDWLEYVKAVAIFENGIKTQLDVLTEQMKEEESGLRKELDKRVSVFFVDDLGYVDLKCIEDFRYSR